MIWFKINDFYYHEPQSCALGSKWVSKHVLINAFEWTKQKGEWKKGTTCTHWKSTIKEDSLSHSFPVGYSHDSLSISITKSITLSLFHRRICNDCKKSRSSRQTISHIFIKLIRDLLVLPLAMRNCVHPRRNWVERVVHSPLRPWRSAQTESCLGFAKTSPSRNPDIESSQRPMQICTEQGNRRLPLG